MSDKLNKNERLITPDQGVELFIMQAELIPEVLEEVTVLSGGSIGIVKAIMMRMGDAISEDPMQETTPARIREVLDAPTEKSELPEWQSSFWDAFKKEQGIN
jgi:hypothetical protein